MESNRKFKLLGFNHSGELSANIMTEINNNVPLIRSTRGNKTITL